MDESGIELGHRGHHEGTFVGARMGKDELDGFDASISEEYEIEVDRAGSPALPLALAIASQPRLDLLQPMEELDRRDPGAQLQHRVQIVALLCRPDRPGLEDGRRRQQQEIRLVLEGADHRREGRLTIPEIGADRHVRDDSAFSHPSPPASWDSEDNAIGATASPAHPGRDGGPYNPGMTQSPNRSAPEARMPTSVEPPETLSPAVRGPVPGPRSRALAARLARVESRNVTALDPVPIFWERASGANLWDVDDNRFVDLTAAFGVANVGHGHPEVVEAVSRQAAALLHGMGDVHPPRVKVELLERLAALYPRGGAASPPPVRTVLSSSGSDAVETAIKTSLLVTGRAGILAFEGAYHGLSLGALDCTWREDFRTPFRARLPGATRFVPFGDLDAVARVAREASGEIGAILVEPVQGRGGERVPPSGFLRGLRQICDDVGWLLIADEIYTGFGRTGAVFACDHESVVPDLLCVGKGLASGMPISACMGLQPVFDIWPRSRGEALHTQTFLGHPTSCAAALASLDVAERWQLAKRARRVGMQTLERLRAGLANVTTVGEVRGLGLMIGIECASAEICLTATERLLARGHVLLPSGTGGSVLSLTPPLTIGEHALAFACDEIVRCLEELADEQRASS